MIPSVVVDRLTQHEFLLLTDMGGVWVCPSACAPTASTDQDALRGRWRSGSWARHTHAHKGQPRIEKRFEQLKTVHEIAPVILKNEARIEALFTLYFLALLVQALIV